MSGRGGSRGAWWVVRLEALWWESAMVSLLVSLLGCACYQLGLGKVVTRIVGCLPEKVGTRAARRDAWWVVPLEALWLDSAMES